MNKSLIYTLIAVGGAVLIGFIVLSGPSTESDSGSDFDVFADITLLDYEGNERTLEEFHGQPLVINSWATWCPFCRAELPDFARLQQQYEAQDVVVMAIDRRESRERAEGYTDEIDVTDRMLFLLDDSDTFYQKIGGFSMPETIFVNAAGEIVVHKRGPMELDEMQEHVEKIIRN
ncbi:MAG: TlpA disulfide reductase family protein [Candidatus Paceibacterota bacterium]